VVVAIGDFNGNNINEIAVAYFAYDGASHVDAVFYQYSSTARTLTLLTTTPLQVKEG
jgi:hypothetical protein